MVIDSEKHSVRPGDAIFIRPLEKHQIFAEGNENVEFVVICAPAWEAGNSVYIDAPVEV